MPPNATEDLLPLKADNTEKNPELKNEDIEDIVEEPLECDNYNFFYGAGDAIFSAFIVAPQVVSVWRGTWGIMEAHWNLFPYAQIFILGILIEISFTIIRRLLLTRSQNAWGEEARASRWVRERILCRIYNYIYILSNVMHWRGGWGLLEAIILELAPEENNEYYRSILYAAFTSIFIVAISYLRSSRNLLASPYFLVTDGKEPTYIYPTRYRRKSSKETALYILDCVFSVTVVGSLVVFVWRGFWALLDIFLYPDDQVKSCWTSLVAGYVIVVLTFGLQAPMRWLVSKLQGAPRLLVADVYHLVSFVATVNVWRGIWGLLDLYFFPETPKLSNWCSHIVSLTLLIVLNCSNSVLVRGVYIDAEEPNGDCVVFPCHYLRRFFHKETVKRHKTSTTASKSPEDANMPLQTPEQKV